MTDPQSVANDIRERVSATDTVQRMAIEILSAAGTSDALTIRARYRRRVLTLTRTGQWWATPASGVADGVARELVAEALSPTTADRVRVVAGPGRAAARPSYPELTDS
jgi:hypothetical protein